MPVRLLLFLFAIITLIIFTLRNQLEARGFDVIILFAGNLLLFLVTLLSSWFHAKGAADKNPNAFVRSVYAGTMLKMFVIMAAVILYALIIKPFNKEAVITCLLLYVIYTVIDVKYAMRTVKQQKSEERNSS
ncbi:MAG: ATP synthase subunit I [Sphingobacteriales bacterium]|nr:ATP synthase subunit I [Sphingobacteriales bacterium]MBI3718953.1 ATP synthase subunit I [Sphingobacteriales bacterium]